MTSINPAQKSKLSTKRQSAINITDGNGGANLKNIEQFLAGTYIKKSSIKFVSDPEDTAKSYYQTPINGIKISATSPTKNTPSLHQTNPNKKNPKSTPFSIAQKSPVSSKNRKKETPSLLKSPKSPIINQMEEKVNQGISNLFEQKMFDENIKIIDQQIAEKQEQIEIKEDFSEDENPIQKMVREIVKHKDRERFAIKAAQHKEITGRELTPPDFDKIHSRGRYVYNKEKRRQALKKEQGKDDKGNKEKKMKKQGSIIEQLQAQLHKEISSDSGAEEYDPKLTEMERHEIKHQRRMKKMEKRTQLSQQVIKESYNQMHDIVTNIGEKLDSIVKSNNKQQLESYRMWVKEKEQRFQGLLQQVNDKLEERDNKELVIQELKFKVININNEFSKAKECERVAIQQSKDLQKLIIKYKEQRRIDKLQMREDKSRIMELDDKLLNTKLVNMEQQEKIEELNRVIKDKNFEIEQVKAYQDEDYSRAGNKSPAVLQSPVLSVFHGVDEIGNEGNMAKLSKFLEALKEKTQDIQIHHKEITQYFQKQDKKYRKSIQTLKDELKEKIQLIEQQGIMEKAENTMAKEISRQGIKSTHSLVSNQISLQKILESYQNEMAADELDKHNYGILLKGDKYEKKRFLKQKILQQQREIGTIIHDKTTPLNKQLKKQQGSLHSARNSILQTQTPMPNKNPMSYNQSTVGISRNDYAPNQNYPQYQLMTPAPVLKHQISDSPQLVPEPSTNLQLLNQPSLFDKRHNTIDLTSPQTDPNEKQAQNIQEVKQALDNLDINLYLQQNQLENSNQKQWQNLSPNTNFTKLNQNAMVVEMQQQQPFQNQYLTQLQTQQSSVQGQKKSFRQSKSVIRQKEILQKQKDQQQSQSKRRANSNSRNGDIIGIKGDVKEISKPVKRSKGQYGNSKVVMMKNQSAGGSFRIDDSVASNHQYGKSFNMPNNYESSQQLPDITKHNTISSINNGVLNSPTLMNINEPQSNLIAVQEVQQQMPKKVLQQPNSNRKTVIRTNQLSREISEIATTNRSGSPNLNDSNTLFKNGSNLIQIQHQPGGIQDQTHTFALNADYQLKTGIVKQGGGVSSMTSHQGSPPQINSKSVSRKNTNQDLKDELMNNL